MGRSKRSFDWLIKVYRVKGIALRLTRVPVLKNIAMKVLDVESMNLSYIPIYENIELPSGTAAPISIIEHFITSASHHVILNRCPCRSENGCTQYDQYFGCIFLGDAARGVDPEVGRHVTKQEALDHLHEAAESGLVSMVGKFRGDAIMLGVKDHSRLMTICHCCPCCCLFGSFPGGAREIMEPFVRLEGVKVEVTEDCNGCGLCVDACLFKQINVNRGTAVIGEECRGCGRCAMVCVRNAVRVTVDNPSYIEECIARIGSRVEVG
jgi:ferredoxin